MTGAPLDLPTLGAGGGILASAAVILTALLRFRTGDRESVVKSQQEHMARLDTERNAAISERNAAWTEVAAWRDRYASEVATRIEAVAEAHTSRVIAESLQAEVTRLSARVAELTTQLATHDTTNTGDRHALG
jgi:hypothetical protein